MAYMDIEEEILREKMKRWGILKDEKADLMYLSSNALLEFLMTRARTRPRVIDVTEEIGDLKKRVRELERRVGGKREPTKVDFVYELFKEELEEKHFGRIVAIDTDLEEIVGVGDTILEAYNKAKEKTGKDQFDFKRVGYKYIHKV